MKRVKRKTVHVVLKLSPAQARYARDWCDDFESMNGSDWPENYPREARLIFELRRALASALK